MRKVWQWITWSPWRLFGVVVLVIAGILALIIWATREEDPNTPVQPSNSVQTSSSAPVDTPSSPVVAPEGNSTPIPDVVFPSASEDAEKAAEAYLSAKENQFTANRSTLLDWIGEAQPVLTEEFYLELIDAPADYGWEWDDYHNYGWTIKVDNTACSPHGDVYDPANTTEITYVCSYSTGIYQSDGSRYWGEMPFGWRDDRSATLTLTNASGTWLVSGDSTGKAG